MNTENLNVFINEPTIYEEYSFRESSPRNKQTSHQFKWKRDQCGKIRFNNISYRQNVSDKSSLQQHHQRNNQRLSELNGTMKLRDVKKLKGVADFIADMTRHSKCREFKG